MVTDNKGLKGAKMDNLDFNMEIPTMEAIQLPELDKVYSAGSIDETMLSPEDKALVDSYVNDLVISDAKQVMSFGSAAQRNIVNFSSTVLNKTKTRDLGDIGDVLKELTVALNSTTEPEKRGIAGLFQRGKRTIEAIKADYAKAETNVMSIERTLEKHQITLMQDIAMFDQMYQLNLQYYKDLTLYIIAGKKILEKAKTVELAKFRDKAERTQLQEDIQAYNDYMNMCRRFEKRLHDLETTRVITIQSSPQIRLIQTNDEEMLEKIQSSIVNTIPLWRNQIVLTLGIEHSSRAVAAQNAITETTNTLLQENAEKLKMATVETAKEAERPVVDVETLRKVNRELIASINEVVRIQEAGAKKREAAEVELQKIEMELKTALLEAGSR